MPFTDDKPLSQQARRDAQLRDRFEHLEDDESWPSGWYILPFAAISALAIAAALAYFFGV